MENASCWKISVGQKDAAKSVSGWRIPCVLKISGAGCNLLVRGGGGGK